MVVWLGACIVMSDFAIPWTVVFQVPLSVEFSRQEYWRGVAISYSRGLSQPRDRTYNSGVSCIGRQVLLALANLESPVYR